MAVALDPFKRTIGTSAIDEVYFQPISVRPSVIVAIRKKPSVPKVATMAAAEDGAALIVAASSGRPRERVLGDGLQDSLQDTR